MAFDHTELMIDPAALKRALNRAATHYEAAAVLERTIADYLLERLNIMRVNPKRVLDFGARTGYTTEHLQRRYPDAEVIGSDYSSLLLSQAKEVREQPLHLVTGDYVELPFATHSFDLIFSNLALQWSNHIQITVEEFQRVLKPGGLLLFTTVGRDTLKELRASFADEKYHVHPFFDMHDIGDLLKELHFENPVMDVEILTVRYATVSALLQDLKLTGANNTLKGRPKGLMGKQQWQTMLAHYERLRDDQGVLPATIELIYGHAFSPFQKTQITKGGAEVFVSLEQLKPTVR